MKKSLLILTIATTGILVVGAAAMIYVTNTQKAEVFGSNGPNDPYFYLQKPTLELINAVNTLSSNNGSGVVVAIIDTGVRFGKDLDETKFVPGYDYLQGRPINYPGESEDDALHGSHVAGIIAQSTNNSFGAVGVAPGARIMPLRVLNAKLQGDAKNAAAAIRFAADNGAGIINLSLAIEQDSEVIREAIEYASGKNVVIIAASGNDGKGTPSYPAAYKEEVLGVGSVTLQGTIAPYSNHAPLYAPGGVVTGESTTPGQEACKEIPVGSQVSGNSLVSSWQNAIVQVVRRVSINPEKENGLMACQGTSQAAPFVAGGGSNIQEKLKPKGIKSPTTITKIILSSASATSSNGSFAKILDIGRATEFTKLLVTPRIQLSASDQGRVDDFAQDLKAAGDTRLEAGMRAMNVSKFKSAFTLYTDVDKLSQLSTSIKVDGLEWNNICWGGSLIAGIKDDKQSVAEMMPACDKAVALLKIYEQGLDSQNRDNKPRYQHEYYMALDSRGVARALAGNLVGAIHDFEEVLAVGYFDYKPIAQKQRQSWIKALAIGQSPFTRKEILTSLKDPKQDYKYWIYPSTESPKENSSALP